jgi:DNA-binding SARP family transcriptional activator
MTDTVHIAVLGGLRIRSTQPALELRGQAAELLGLLAVERAQGGDGDRDRLAGLLWPDIGQAEARRRLAVALFRLRKTLGPLGFILQISPDTATLRDVTVDAEAFEAEVAGADPPRLGAILETYQGDLLESFSAEWLNAPRARWRAACLAALPRLVAELDTVGDSDQALAWARRWQALEPLDDAACAAQMRLLWRAKRHGEAGRCFDAFARALRQELNVEPDTELRQLARAIARENEAASRSDNMGVLVGRSAERAELLRALDDNAAPAVILLVGDPGMGKTSLLDEITDAARWRGMAVARAQASEVGGSAAGAPLTDALLHALTPAVRERLSRSVGKTGWQVILDTLPPLAPPSAAARVARPASLPMVFRTLLQELSRMLPTVVLLDDAHWADPACSEFLDQAHELMQGQPLRIVLSARLSELSRNTPLLEALKRLDAAGHLRRIRLGPLTEQNTWQLAQMLVPGMPREEALAIHQQGGGNPLVVRALLAARLGNRAALAGLADVYVSRLAALSAAAREALARGALFSRELTLDEWTAVCDAPSGVPLAELLASELILQTDTGYALQHDLLRAHIVNAQPAAAREAAHARIARALTERHAPPAEIAAHDEQAGLWAQACAHLRAAADEAIRLSAVANATALAARVEQAISQGKLGERERLHARHLRLRLAQARAWSDDAQAEAVALTRDALALEDWTTAIWAMRAQFRVLGLAGRFDELRALGDEAVRVADQAGQRRAAVEALNEVAQLVSNYQLDTAHALALTVEAERRARALDDGSPASAALRADVLLSRVAMHFKIAEAEKAVATLRAIDTLREQHPGLPMNDLAYLGARGYAAQAEEDFELALACHSQRASQAALRGDGPQQIVALQNAGHVALIVGQMGDAAMFYSGLVRLALERNDARATMFRCGLGDALLEAEDAEGAAEVLEAVREWLDQEPRTGMQAFQSLISLSTLYRAQGRYEASLDCLRRVLTLERAKGTLTYMPQLMFARVAMDAGLPDEAREVFEQARPQVDLSRTATDVVYFHWVDWVLTRQPLALARARDTLFRMGYRLKRREFRRDAVIGRHIGREIALAWDELALPGREARAFAGWDVPAARPARDNERVPVTCTVDDGALDAEIARAQDKVALRQHRLQRIALEANLSSAAATHEELAELLGVTPRTIERDVQALAARGVTLFTRRYRI